MENPPTPCLGQPLKDAFLAYLRRRPDKMNEYFLRTRSSAYTFQQMADSLEANEPAAMRQLVTLIAMAADLVTRDQSNLPEPSPPTSHVTTIKNEPSP
jgi:hypothetical protein